MTDQTEPTLLQSLDYQPVASHFGTSGVRALVKDLTDLEVFSLTLGAIRYLTSTGKLQAHVLPPAQLQIPLAGDLRPSTDRLLRATARAILDAGHGVDYLGKLPTPALTFYALQQGIASFMITGSHIPADRNGQKANRCDGEVMKSDEQGIVAAVEAVRQEEYGRPFKESPFDEHGMLKAREQPELPPADSKAEKMYLERYRNVFPLKGLKGIRIVFYQYAAVGRDLLPVILRNTGAEVISAGRSDEFVPIDTEAISQQHLRMLLALALEQRKQHGRIDAVVSTDGDSDRPLVVGVEEKPFLRRIIDWIDGSVAFLKSVRSGQSPRAAWVQFRSHTAPITVRFFPGDLLGIVVADYLKADAVSIPISANPAVDDYFEPGKTPVRKTRIGSPYVIQAMQAALNDGYRRVVSWEANGGFLLGSDIELNDGALKALPSRDAILPILCVLHAAAEQSKSLSELFDTLPKWYGSAGLIDDFPQETSRAILEYFSPAEEAGHWTEFGPEEVVLRDVNQQIVVQWPNDDPRAQTMRQKREILEKLFSPAKGFGRVIRINTQDGVRCYFSNDNIAHIRPSGNAPQLRIYAQARTQERADAIVAMGIAEPEGLLRSLARLVEQAGG
jgi:phosphomannomutase